MPVLRDEFVLPAPPTRVRQKIYTQQGLRAKRSAAQQANTIRQQGLMTEGRDYDKRAGGQNSKIENALVGDLDPKYLIKRELPVHRTMVNMAAAGYTSTEIAKAVGWSASAVSNVLKQPHSRQYLINEAKKTVQDDIKALLEQEVMPSIRSLVHVRDNSDKGSEVIAASGMLLDRALGKATQPIAMTKDPSSMSDEELREQIERELSASKPN